MLVGVDVGYGWTKGCTYVEDTIYTQVFPSSIAVFTDYTFQKPQIIGINGKKFLCGKNVEEFAAKPIPIVRDDFTLSYEHVALLGQCLGSLYLDINKESSTETSHFFDIVTGLPPGLFSEKIIREIRNRILDSDIFYEKDTSFKIVVKNIDFVPQGYGAYLSFVKNNNINPKDAYVLIDVGYYTVDFVLVVNGRFANQLAVSYPIGVKNFYDMFKSFLQRKFNIFITSDSIIDSILESGTFTHFKKSITVDHIDIHTALDNYKSVFINYIKEYAKRVDIPIKNIVLTGGGLKLIHDFIDGVHTVKYPQIANAIGYYWYGKTK